MNNGLWSTHRDEGRLSTTVPKVFYGAQGFLVWNLKSGIFDPADTPRGGHPLTPHARYLAPALKATARPTRGPHARRKT